MQYDSFLFSSFNQEDLITFYASVPVPRFSELRKLLRNLASAFGSACTREQIFFFMHETKQTDIPFKNH